MNMIRVIVLVLISFSFTALSIYANCDLPTGGACSLEDLRKEQQKMSEMLSKEKFFDQVDDNYKREQENGLKNELPKQVDIKLNDKTFDN